MSKRTPIALQCQCGHKGRAVCVETDQAFSGFRESYRVEGFLGLALVVTREADRPADLLAALEPRCPKCRVGPVAYAKPSETFEARRMAARALDFMHAWIDANITAGVRPASAEMVDALAGKCATDAASLGIALGELQAEMGADARQIIFDALVNDPNDEFEALIGGRRH